MTFDPAGAIRSMKHGLPMGAASDAPVDQDQFAFQRWWYNEGSAMKPDYGEDAEDFALRVTAIAWPNGAYKARERE